MKPRPLVLYAALLGLLAKLYCAATTIGTNDTETFYNFGRFIHEHGLLAQYRATPAFNHTPLVGWFCAGIYALGQGAFFGLLLRLPGILADLVSVWVLLRWRSGDGPPPQWALILFALSPVQFMVSGFHGNVDAILAALLLLAVREGVHGRAGWCGIFLGLACQVKVIPLLLAPAFFFFWTTRGRGWPFFIAASTTILAGWSVPLMTIPEVFLRNVLGYSSNWGSWGITYLLHATGAPAFAPVGFQGLTAGETAIMSGLKWGIVAAAGWMGWRRRRSLPHELPTTILLVWTVFLVFAPGVGAQYLVWFTPLLLLHSPCWFVAVTTASSVFLFAFYTTICHGLPWNLGISTAELLPQWVAWSCLPWLVLVAFLFSIFLSRDRAMVQTPEGR